eukprot:18194_1
MFYLSWIQSNVFRFRDSTPLHLTKSEAFTNSSGHCYRKEARLDVMATFDTYSYYVTICYIGVYASIFIIAALFSAYDVYAKHSKPSKPPTTLSTQPEQEEALKSPSLQTDIIQIEDLNDEQSPTQCCKFLKLFFKSLWVKKSIYLSLIPHLFDQGTDFGVIWKYYGDMQQQHSQPEMAESDTTINYAAIFWCSTAVIVVHKVMSCSVIYALTESICSVILQFFDLMMVKAIYSNYKSETDEPGNSQKLLQILEGTFESGPQIFISLVYLFKTKQSNNALILVSLLSSFWTLTSRVNADDKNTIDRPWRDAELNYKGCPIINWRYVVRVLLRYLEITHRILLLSLLWISLGGFAVGVILCFEMLIVSIIAIESKNVMMYSYLLYLTFINVKESMWFTLFATYRLLSPVLYMILMTIFVCVSFDSWKVDPYQVRHSLVIKNPLNFTAFIYCWIVSFFMPCYALFFAKYLMDGERVPSRDLKRMAVQGQWEDISNLILFGISKSHLFHCGDGTIMHYIFFCNDFDTFTTMTNLIYEQDHEIVNATDKWGRLCSAAFPKGGQRPLKYINYLVTHFKMNQHQLLDDLSICGWRIIFESKWEDWEHSPEMLSFCGSYGTLMHYVFELCSDFELFKSIATAFSDQPNADQLWVATDRYGMLCGDVGFYNDGNTSKFIEYLVEKLNVNARNIVNGTTAFDFMIKYGEDAKWIIKHLDIKYDEETLNQKLQSVSDSVPKIYYQHLTLDFTLNAEKYMEGRAVICETVADELRGYYAIKEEFYEDLKQMIEYDPYWLRYRVDPEGFHDEQCSHGLSLIEIALEYPVKHKELIQWCREKGFISD